MIAIALNFINPYPENNNSGEVVGWWSCVIITVFLFIFIPIVIYWLNKLPRRIFTNKSFNERFSIMVEDIRYDSRWYINYFTIFCIRRIIFCLIVFVIPLASMQRLGLYYTNLFMLIYTTTKPFKERTLNKF